MAKRKKKIPDLDPKLFKKNPAWFRGAVAHRLVQLMIPRAFSRKLPGRFRKPLHLPDALISPDWRPGDPTPPGIVVAPGATFPPGWTPGDKLPPGVFVLPEFGFSEGWTPGDPLPSGFSVQTGQIFPPGWTPGDPLPAGIIIAPGVTFPPGWMPGDPLPMGATVNTAIFFPPGWTPGDPLPEGFIVDSSHWFPPEWMPGDPPPEGLLPWPTLPPGTPESGIMPPGYLGPGAPKYPGPGGAPPTTLKSTTIKAYNTDGVIEHLSGDWDICRNAASGTLVTDGSQQNYDTNGMYSSPSTFFLYRAFFEFPLTAISAGANIISATLRIHGYGNDFGNVCAQAGTFSGALALGDYSAFTGGYFGAVVWTIHNGAGGVNEIDFNAAGLAFLKTRFGLTASIVTREYNYDYLRTTAPPWNTTKQNGGYFRDSANAAYHPELDIVYEE